eukprot:gene15428-biopygen6674
MSDRNIILSETAIFIVLLPNTTGQFPDILCLVRLFVAGQWGAQPQGHWPRWGGPLLQSFPPPKVAAKFRELQNGIRKCITPHGVTKHCWGAQWWGSRPPPPKQGGMAEDAFGTGPLPQILPCAGRVLCRFSHPKSRSTSTPQPSRRAPAPGTLEPGRRRRTPNERVPAIPGARFRGRWPVAAHMRSGSAPALLWKGPCRAADAEPLRRRQRGGDGHHPPCGLAAGGGGVAIKLCRWRDEMDARVLYFVPASRPPKSGAS